jgi:hypothetical protein
LDGGTWTRMCWRMSPSFSWEVVVSDDPGLACPSPWCQNIKCRVVWARMCRRMSPNSGGHDGHGETGEYAVRRGRKSTFG